jgi:hypothetical protein
MAKKDDATHSVKIVVANGTAITLGPISQKEATEIAKTACREGYEKDGTYYPVHQIMKAKVYETQIT